VQGVHRFSSASATREAQLPSLRAHEVEVQAEMIVGVGIAERQAERPHGGLDLVRPRQRRVAPTGEPDDWPVEVDIKLHARCSV
jgi:hypothetical protein